MVNGNLIIGNAPKFENLESLKKWLNSIKNNSDNEFGYAISSIDQLKFSYTQAGTAGLVDLSEKGGLTITNIGAEGTVFVWQEADTEADRGKEVTLLYVDDVGALHYGYAVLDAEDTTTEAQFMTTSGGIVAVSDYYRIRSLTFVQVAGKYIAIGPTGGASQYGVIEEGNVKSLHSNYTCPKDRIAWLACVKSDQSVGTNVLCTLAITHIPYGESIFHIKELPIPNNAKAKNYPLLKLAENTEMSFKILGNLASFGIDLYIIEITLKV